MRISISAMTNSWTFFHSARTTLGSVAQKISGLKNDFWTWAQPGEVTIR